MTSTQDRTGLVQAPHFPSEIVWIIVSLRRTSARAAAEPWRKDIQNLSLVRSDFVDPCQAAIFEYVVIQPPSWTVNGVTGEGPDLALRFSELIAKRPQLGQYVLSLLYRLPSISRAIRDKTEAAGALAHLTQVRYLQVEYEESRERENEALDWAYFTQTKWRRGREPGYPRFFEAFQGLIGREGLKTLVLKNIRIPAEVLGRAKNLETLQLDGSDCHLPSEPVGGSLNTPLLVKHLFLSGSAPHDLGWDLSGESRHPVAFTNLDTLHTALGGKRYEEHAKKVILSQAAHLRRLELYTPEDHPFVASQAGNKHQHLNPLRHVHSDAYSTLTTLYFDIVFFLSDASDIISDPWQGLCSDNTLRGLQALQYLTVKVWIGGPAWGLINADANFLNPKWRNLERVLVPKHSEFTLDSLKAVELVVGIYGNCRTAPRGEVDAFLPRIQRRALSLPWMPRLVKKARKGSLSVATRMGRRHYKCHEAQCPG